MKSRKFKKLLLKLGLYAPIQKLYVHTLKRKHLQRLALEAKLYGSFIKSGDLCFDVGANIGDKSEVFLTLGARVVAIEPQLYCTEILRARFAKNPRFTCISKGAGEKTGESILYTSKNNVGAASFLPIKDDLEGRIKVKLTTLDEIISEYGIPKFCKIDVEGFELSVLKGLSSVIDVISFEYHLTEKGLQCAIECLHYLAKLANRKLYVNVVSSVFFDGLMLDRGIDFLSAEWWDVDSFIPFLRSELPKIKDYFYGDIFVWANPH